jgi:NADPH:quinone reductase-like Zn-dependent oxidoreductase
VSFEGAATLPVSGVTAMHAVHDHGRVQEGQHVLVTGASGGVGSFAVQLAKAAGTYVTGVCSSAKADFVRSLGAEDIVDHTREDFADGSRATTSSSTSRGTRHCPASVAPSPHTEPPFSSAARTAAP